MNKSFNNLEPIAKQAAWHFIQGIKDPYDVGAIVDPYKYRYTDNRELDLYPKWSELCLNYEFELTEALENPEKEYEFLVDFEAAAKEIEFKF